MAPPGRRAQPEESERALAVTGYVAALVVLAIELGNANRRPIPWSLAALGFLAMHLGTGFFVRQWRWLPLPLLLVAIAVVVGAMTENFGAFFLVVVATPVGLLLFVLAVGIGRLVERRARARPARRRMTWAVAAASLVLVPLPLLVAVVDKHRTVRGEGGRPILIEEHRGKIGVGLRDSAAKVRQALGPPAPRSQNRLVIPLDADDHLHGIPSSPAYGGRRTRLLVYRKVAFTLVDGRVVGLDIIDRRARTRRDVRVGDSLSLVRRAYPELRCGEGDAGSDEPVPFPFCTGRTGRGVYAYFGADYRKAGTPVTNVTFYTRPIP